MSWSPPYSLGPHRQAGGLFPDGAYVTGEYHVLKELRPRMRPSRTLGSPATQPRGRLRAHPPLDQDNLLPLLQRLHSLVELGLGQLLRRAGHAGPVCAVVRSLSTGMQYTLS